ncbi:MAG: 4Fe-4S cluster-binding domain-containing protein [Bacteroidales bacterium]|nr:4Fe-4S cluster-binding domain-containing protein [Bacteroidales bacterium]
MDFSSLLNELDILHDCALCPRDCHADRFTAKRGYCNAGTGFSISSICIHRGEEPIISGSRGICNIFFTHCNLQCMYCQNHQISDNLRDHGPDEMQLEEVIRQVTGILDTGINIVGFVSPSHMVPQMKAIIRVIGSLGYKPTWVYNTNGYDKTDTLRGLEGIIDVYLPDLKYMDSGQADRLSDAADYPVVAGAALKEMLRQKGTALRVNEEGYAESGILIRHLVLPGTIRNSIEVLRFIATELSPLLHIGLMSQYYPANRAFSDPELSRSLARKEYARAVKAMEAFGINRGYIQGLASYNHYRPDFNKNHPFEPD